MAIANNIKPSLQINAKRLDVPALAFVKILKGVTDGRLIVQSIRTPKATYEAYGDSESGFFVRISPAGRTQKQEEMRAVQSRLADKIHQCSTANEALKNANESHTKLLTSPYIGNKEAALVTIKKQVDDYGAAASKLNGEKAQLEKQVSAMQKALNEGELAEVTLEIDTNELIETTFSIPLVPDKF